MSFNAIIIQLFNGLISGSFYVLLSIGLTIIFGMMGVVNFAQGALYMLGAYAAYSWVYLIGGGFWLALIIAPLTVGIIGAFLERTLLQRLYKVEPLYNLLLTFGIMLALQDTIRIFFGPIEKKFDIPDALGGAVNLGFMYYPKYRLFIIGMTALFVFAMWMLIGKTKLGAIIRAGTEDSEMVDAIGIDVRKIFTVTFGIGAALAGVAGVLASPIQNIKPWMGMDFLVPIFVVVVVGGMGSIGGSILGGLIVGEVITLGVMLWPPIAHTLIYVIMAIILLVRPRGLFGRAEFHD
ncbi:MAG: branched-chain amino acid ABC transporter permease [Candidatus Bathyarchaeia archaeon]